MNEHDHSHDACDDSGFDRRNFMAGCGAAAALAMSGIGVSTAVAEETEEGDIEELLEDLPDNWNEWGGDDERGALNLLGSEQAFAGMRAATRRGAKHVEQFTLQVPMTGDTIESVLSGGGTSEDAGDPIYPPRTPARRNNTGDYRGYEDDPDEPVTFKSSDDAFVTKLFLHGTTHIDALGHVWYGDELYNGYSEKETGQLKQFDEPIRGLDEEGEAVDLDETYGHSQASVAPLAASGIAGRGVLLDVGRQMGDDNGWLELGASVTLEDLRATADAQGVKLRDRDIILVRTGGTERAVDPDAEWGPLAEAGLTFSEELVEWVHEMEIPMIGADNIAVEKLVQVIDGKSYVIPLHCALLRDLGVTLNEIMWLKDLADQCAEDGIYEFLYTAAPLHVERATGAPVNPVVLKAVGEDRGRRD